MGLAIQNQAARIKIGAERRAGVLIAALERAQGARDGRKGLRNTLVQSGVEPMTAHRWQTMATVPEAEVKRLEVELTATEVGAEENS